MVCSPTALWPAGTSPKPGHHSGLNMSLGPSTSLPSVDADTCTTPKKHASAARGGR